MSSSRINRGGRPIPGAFNAEFTPGQMVIGICVLFFVVAVAFGAGILVGRGDPSLHPAPGTQSLAQADSPKESDTAAAKPADTIPTPPPPRSAASTTPAAPAPLAPTAESPPSAPSATAPVAVPPLPPAPKTTDPKGPRSVELPPLPSAGKNSNRTVEVPVQMAKPATADSPATPAALPPLPVTKPSEEAAKGKDKGKEKEAQEAAAKQSAADAATAAKTKADAPTKPTAPASKTQVAKVDGDDALAEDLLDTGAISAPKSGAKGTAAPAPAKGAATGSSGNFGLQVGAFPGPKREAQANELKKKVEAAGLHAEIRTSKTKDLYRVLVVGYKDRASAIKAQNELKQRPGFTSVFVQDLSKL